MSIRGMNVGYIHLKENFSWVQWDSSYWERPDREIVSLHIENLGPRGRLSSNVRLPCWFSNLLPEGQMRSDLARSLGISKEREYLLLEGIGRELPGAIEVIPDDSIDPPQPDLITPTAVLDTQRTSHYPQDKTHLFSLAGMVTKFSLVNSTDHLAIPTINQDGDWIVKMPSRAYAQLPKNEFAVMGLAKKCGISIPEISLVSRNKLPEKLQDDSFWPAGEEYCYAIKRFDRSESGRVHMEDLAQVRGFYPEDKYAGSFETVAALIYRKRNREDLTEFLRRLIFSILIGNGDMHLKNISLVYDNPFMACLSPAYDIVSTVPYIGVGKETLGLDLAGSRSIEHSSFKEIIRLVDKIEAPKKCALDARDSVLDSIADGWTDQRHILDDLPKHVSYIDKRLKDLHKWTDASLR